MCIFRGYYLPIIKNQMENNTEKFNGRSAFSPSLHNDFLQLRCDLENLLCVAVDSLALDRSSTPVRFWKRQSRSCIIG